MNRIFVSSILLFLSFRTLSYGFAPVPNNVGRSNRQSIIVRASTEKAAPSVTGEELEIMLTEMEQPIVVDAYATW